MSAPLGRPLDLPAAVRDIAETLEAAGHQAWCVGGALRDLLIGDPESDFDIATSATPEQVQALFRRTVPIGVAFGTVGVLDPEGRLHEVTSFRRDVSTDGRRAVVAYGASLDEDLARRDFTINAIAYHPGRGEWRDPYGGAADLEARVLRTVGAPADRFREDYLRILRGIRFSARFQLEIDLGTWDAMCSQAPGLEGLSAERVRDEWFKGLRTADPLRRLVALWHDTGAAGIWIPEMGPPTEVHSHAYLPRDPVVLTAYLCRNPGTVVERLRGSRAEIARAVACGVGPIAPPEDGHEAAVVRRWMASVRESADDFRLLARYASADGSPAVWADVMDGIRARGEAVARHQLAVSGHDLEAAGIPQGRRIGEILDRLLERVLDDPSLNTRDQLLALVAEVRGD